MSTFVTTTSRGRRNVLVVAAAALTLPLTACDDAASAAKSETGRFYGAEIAIGSGNARSYVVLENGVPTEIGIALSEQALNNLPERGEIHNDHANMTEWFPPLPAGADLTPYKLIVLGWNPGGHEPPGIYDIPHFDFHFYTMTLDERNEIDPALPTFQERASRILTPEQVPAGYVGTQDVFGVPAAAATVPRMGLHWIDPKAPELNGEPFTTTYLYGSFDGRPIFGEPMITKAFLESKPDFSAPIPQPQQYGGPGYYPTRYTVRWDEQAREYRIALTGLAKREQ